MARLRAALGMLRRWFPIRPAGAGALALSAIAVFHYGRGRGDLLLYVIGGTGLALCLVAVLLVAVSAWVVRKRFREEATDPLHLDCDVPADAGSFLRIPRIPLVEVHWQWRSPQVRLELERYGGLVAEKVTPRRRGRHQELVRQVSVGDIFGIAAISFVTRTPRELRFAPSTGALENVPTITGLAGGDELAHPEGDPMGDRMDMRRYGAGDPIKFILWKVFAKSRTVVVRSPERAFSPAQQVVAYLVTAWDDQASAGAVRVAIEQGAMGADWLLGVDGTAETASHGRAGLELVITSASTPADQQGAGLADFILRTANRVRRLMIFVPPTPGPWLPRVVAAIGVPSTRVDVVIGTDGVELAETASGCRTWIHAPAVDDRAVTTRFGQLQSVVTTLTKAGANVLLADRKTGEVFPTSQLERMKVA